MDLAKFVTCDKNHVLWTHWIYHSSWAEVIREGFRTDTLFARITMTIKKLNKPNSIDDFLFAPNVMNLTSIEHWNGWFQHLLYKTLRSLYLQQTHFISKNFTPSSCYIIFIAIDISYHLICDWIIDLNPVLWVTS